MKGETNMERDAEILRQASSILQKLGDINKDANITALSVFLSRLASAYSESSANKE
jgi:hypothetical protein